MSVVNPSLAELEARRAELYQRLARLGDFRRGSVSENFRRCGKANCACAAPSHPGHGPRWLWTRTARGGKTVGRQLAPGEVDKVRREIAAHAEFAALAEEIAEVNEAICEARAAPAAAADDGGGGQDAKAGRDGQKRGSATRSRRRSAGHSRPRSTG